jgi:ketopantoate hydroxymethyltransferase
MEATMTRITQLIVGLSVVGIIAIGSAAAQSLVEHDGVGQQETRPKPRLRKLTFG